VTMGDGDGDVVDGGPTVAVFLVGVIPITGGLIYLHVLMGPIGERLVD
jgi:hypothetical protein